MFELVNLSRCRNYELNDASEEANTHSQPC